MQEIATERSPGSPSLMVTTRRRTMPQGTSCSFLHEVAQALHSMQRSVSQRKFSLVIPILLFLGGLDAAQSRFCFLHLRHDIIPICLDRIRGLADHKRRGTFRIAIG